MGAHSYIKPKLRRASTIKWQCLWFDWFQSKDCVSLMLETCYQFHWKLELPIPIPPMILGINPPWRRNDLWFHLMIYELLNAVIEFHYLSMGNVWVMHQQGFIWNCGKIILIRGNVLSTTLIPLMHQRLKAHAYPNWIYLSAAHFSWRRWMLSTKDGNYCW